MLSSLFLFQILRAIFNGGSPLSSLSRRAAYTSVPRSNVDLPYGTVSHSYRRLRIGHPHDISSLNSTGRTVCGSYLLFGRPLHLRSALFSSPVLASSPSLVSSRLYCGGETGRILDFSRFQSPKSGDVDTEQCLSMLGILDTIPALWDYSNTPVLRNDSVDTAVEAFKSELLMSYVDRNGRDAPYAVGIFAFVTEGQLNSARRMEMLRCGVTIVWISPGKNIADIWIRLCIDHYDKWHPFPSSILVASGDGKFAKAIERRKKRHIMHVVSNHSSCASEMRGAGTYNWNWTDLMKKYAPEQKQDPKKTWFF